MSPKPKAGTGHFPLFPFRVELLPLATCRLGKIFIPGKQDLEFITLTHVGILTQTQAGPCPRPVVHTHLHIATHEAKRIQILLSTR